MHLNRFYEFPEYSPNDVGIGNPAVKKLTEFLDHGEIFSDELAMKLSSC